MHRLPLILVLALLLGCQTTGSDQQAITDTSKTLLTDCKWLYADRRLDPVRGPLAMDERQPSPEAMANSRIVSEVEKPLIALLDALRLQCMDRWEHEFYALYFPGLLPDLLEARARDRTARAALHAGLLSYGDYVEMTQASYRIFRQTELAAQTSGQAKRAQPSGRPAPRPNAAEPFADVVEAIRAQGGQFRTSTCRWSAGNWACDGS